MKSVIFSGQFQSNIHWQITLTAINNKWTDYDCSPECTKHRNFHQLAKFRKYNLFFENALCFLFSLSLHPHYFFHFNLNRNWVKCFLSRFVAKYVLDLQWLHYSFNLLFGVISSIRKNYSIIVRQIVDFCRTNLSRYIRRLFYL